MLATFNTKWICCLDDAQTGFLFQPVTRLHLQQTVSSVCRTLVRWCFLDFFVKWWHYRPSPATDSTQLTEPLILYGHSSGTPDVIVVWTQWCQPYFTTGRVHTATWLQPWLCRPSRTHFWLRHWLGTGWRKHCALQVNAGCQSSQSLRVALIWW